MNSSLEKFRRLKWQPIPFALALGALGAWHRGAGVDTLARNRSNALCGALASEKHLSCDEADVTWIRGANGISGAMIGDAVALVRAHEKNELFDLYLVGARLSPEGVLLDVGRVHNLTSTSGVDESRPLTRGHFSMYWNSADGTITSLHALDLAGRDPASFTDLSRGERIQTEVTNWIATGQSSGVVHHVFVLDPVATQVTFANEPSPLSEDEFALRADGRVIVIRAKDGSVRVGAGWVRASPEQHARPPSFFAWARTVGSSFFGDEQMFVAKAVAMTALDWAGRIQGFFGSQDEQSRVQEELGNLGNQAAAPTFIDPEMGWPPEPLKPILNPALTGEGRWIELLNDSFITPGNGLPPAFVTTFLRPDKERKDVRIYVTMWDPRQIALHMQAGTVEPVSATGEAGPGSIPRVPEVLSRVVAGFNGGFQAQHGEYGMQADGVLYLPPKPYAASVLELKDGTTAFGSWPSSQQIPDEVFSYRQNLTAIVENGKFNPWGRVWWGGTPPDWKDNIHTTRSGACLTKEHFVAYFWGADTSAEALAGAMIGARCTYGIHLDMNPGMAGFEFYDVEPSATWKPLGRPLQTDWEFEGTFKALPDFHYRARRMIRGMQQQNFPQYIHLDGRDFFYLTRRPLLPGANLPTDVQDGTWRTKGLPQHGFPFAIATIKLRSPDAPLHMLRLDPRAVRPAASAGTSESTPTVVTFTEAAIAHPATNSLFLIWSKNALLVRDHTGSDELPLARVAKLDPNEAETATACIQDEDGMLAWIEVNGAATSETTKRMDAALSKAGCSQRYAVRSSTRALLGGTLDLDNNVVSVPIGTVARFVRGETVGARPYFESTPIVSPSIWQPLQMQRVRYFPKPRSSDGGTNPADAGVSTIPSNTAAAQP